MSGNVSTGGAVDAPMAPPSRNLTIDIARGISIVLVVVGHNWIVLPKASELTNVLSFRTPLFFFLSGVFMKPYQPGAFKTGVDSLLKPYFVVQAGLAIKKAVAGQDVVGHIAGVLYGTGSTVDWVPHWFLPHLFVARLFSAKLLQLIGSRIYLLAGVGAVLLVVGATFIDFFWRIPVSSLGSWSFLFGSKTHLPGLPFSLDLLPISAACVLFGFALRDRVRQTTFNPRHFALALAPFVVLNAAFDEGISMNYRAYGNLFIATTTASLGGYLVVMLSAFLTRFRLARSVLTYVGSSSLFILLFHEWFQTKSIDLLSALTHTRSNYGVGVAAYLIAITLPLLLLEIVKRQRFLAALLLPRKMLERAQKSRALTAPASAA